MVADELDVVGVETHKHTHTAAALHPTGAVIDHVTVLADRAGYRRLIAFAVQHGERRLWAVEGTGTFGAGLCAALSGHDEAVVEVDRPQRPARRAGAKSDDIDAVRAARQALAGIGLSEPRSRGDREAIRVLLTTRAQAIEFRTRAICALHALVTSAPDRLRALPLGELLTTCAALRGSTTHSSEEFATTMALRATARRALACQAEAAELETQLAALVRQVAPSLLERAGVGPVVAGQIVASWSHRGRVRSEAAFARLAGVAPIEASSAPSPGTASTAAVTANSTEPCTPSCSSACVDGRCERPGSVRGSADRSRRPRAVTDLPLMQTGPGTVPPWQGRGCAGC